jgi:hypothetical protein
MNLKRSDEPHLERVFVAELRSDGRLVEPAAEQRSEGVRDPVRRVHERAHTRGIVRSSDLTAAGYSIGRASRLR